MAKFNQAIVVGRLTRDPQVRYTGSKKAVCEITLGFNTGLKDNEKSNFIDVTFWEKQAEFCGEFLTKGQEVLVVGELNQESWEDKESGQKRSKMCLRGLTVQMLGAKKGSVEAATETSSDNSSEPESTGNDGDVPF
jgi:single-strand DNA-binding protein